MELKISPPTEAWQPYGFTLNIRAKKQWGNIYICTIFARLAEQSIGEAQESILDEMERVLSVHEKAWREEGGLPYQWNEYGHHPRDYWREASHDSFFTFCIERGLYRYVQAKVEAANGRLPKKIGRPLLDYACSKWSVKAAASVNMVKLLLEYGADPNEEFHGSSPWKNALYIKGHFGRSPYGAQIFDLLIQYEADINACIIKNDYRMSALEVFKKVAEKAVDTKRLAKLLEQKGAKSVDEPWKPKSKLLGLRKSSKDYDEFNGNQKSSTRRARRYLARLFKPNS